MRLLSEIIRLIFDILVGVSDWMPELPAWGIDTIFVSVTWFALTAIDFASCIILSRVNPETFLWLTLIEIINLEKILI